MKPLTLFVFAIALTMASAARAEEPTVSTDRSSANLEVGYGMTHFREDDNRIRQSRLTLAPEFLLGSRLRLAPIMRMTTTSIDLLQKNSMSFDASLSFPWQPSLGSRLSYNAVDYGRLHLDIIGEFEVSLGQNRAWLSSFTPRGDIAKLDINVDTLRNHVTVDHDWRTMQLTARLRGDFGRFHPYVDLGYLSMNGRLAVNFDGTATGMLRDAKLSPNRFYDNGSSSLYYMVGMKIDLGKGIAFRAAGTLLPASDYTIYVGEATLIFPLDIRF